MSDVLRRKISTTLLPRVKTPAQYIGSEINQIKKDHSVCDVTVALAFPDTYAIGMSNLSFAILYAALNQMSKVTAERTFCPWIDAEKIMRENDIPLFSWESRTPVKDFDIVGVTLQHELSYSNILYLLDLAGIEAPTSMQGRSLAPLLAGETPPDWRTDFFVEHLFEHPEIPKHEGVRGRRFKYARYFEQLPIYEELYDFLADSLETNNLAGNPEYLEILTRLRRRTDEMRAEYESRR